MKCPACANELQEMTVADITVDVCKGGCGGIWFDQYELSKVDEPHESLGEHLLDVERNGDIKVDHTRKRMCPRCDDTVMMRHFNSFKNEVEVDECPRCAGYWFDQGELAQIRDQFDTEEERRKAAGEMFAELCRNELAEMERLDREKHAKADRIVRMFRFFCPSHFIPGKQKWGAY